MTPDRTIKTNSGGKNYRWERNTEPFLGEETRPSHNPQKETNETSY